MAVSKEKLEKAYSESRPVAAPIEEPPVKSEIAILDMGNPDGFGWQLLSAIFVMFLIAVAAAFFFARHS